MQEWEKVYTECVELKLSDVDGNWLIKDFIYAVESVSPGWLEYWKNNIQNCEWEKKKLPTFFKLVVIYQNTCCIELTLKGKLLQGSFAATLKGELSELLVTLKLKPELSVDEKKKEGQLVQPYIYGKCHYLN